MKQEEIDNAIICLIKHGRESFKKPLSVSRGQALGAAIYPYFDARGILEMASEMLEQNNYHELCGKIRNYSTGV